MNRSLLLLLYTMTKTLYTVQDVPLIDSSEPEMPYQLDTEETERRHYISSKVGTVQSAFMVMLIWMLNLSLCLCAIVGVDIDFDVFDGC